MARPVVRLPRVDAAPLPVVWVHTFDNAAVQAFASEVSIARSERAPLLVVAIHSPGGDAYSLLAMLDVLASYEGTTATVAVGQAMSCGAVLFSAGTPGHRYAAPRATFLLHDASGDAGGGPIAEQRASVSETERINRLVWATLDRNTRAPLSTEHQRRGGVDWFLDAREAVRVGLASRVGVPLFETRIRWDMMLGEASG